MPTDRPSESSLSAAQFAYAAGLLERRGYGQAVTIAWRPLFRSPFMRKLAMNQPGIGTRRDQWLKTLTGEQASALIDTLKDEP